MHNSFAAQSVRISHALLDTECDCFQMYRLFFPIKKCMSALWAAVLMYQSVIPSNSTETVLLTKLRSPKMELKASGDTADGRGWRKAVTHAAVKEVCKEKDDHLFAITAQVQLGNKRRSRAALASQLSVG